MSVTFVGYKKYSFTPKKGVTEYHIQLKPSTEEKAEVTVIELWRTYCYKTLVGAVASVKATTLRRYQLKA